MIVLEDRAIAALIFVFAFPNTIPLPPGASSVLGAPLLFLTAQLALGRRPWLPSFIARRTIERAQFAAMVQKIAPWLARIERLLRPRLHVLVRPPVEYLIGALCFLLAVILFLPIPMGNMPPAAAICLFSLALLERDGLWAIFGLGVAATGLILISGVLYGLIRGAIFMFSETFG
jgi:hypothetical protein